SIFRWSTWARNAWGNVENTQRRQRIDELKPVASDSSGFPSNREAHDVNIHVNTSGNSNNIINQNLPFDKGPSQINITVHTNTKQLPTGDGTNIEAASNRNRIRNGSLKSDENDGQYTASRNRHHRKEGEVAINFQIEKRNRPDGKTGGDGDLLGAGESDSGRGKHGDKNGGKKGDLNVGDVDKSDSKKGKAGGKNLKGTGDGGKSDSKEVEVKIGDSKSRGDSDADDKKSKSKDGEDSGKIPKTKGGLGDGDRKLESKEENDSEENPKKKGNRGVVDVKSKLKGKNESGEDLKKQKGSPGGDGKKSDSKGRKGDGGNLKAGGDFDSSEEKGDSEEKKDNGGNLKSKGDLRSSEEKLNSKEEKEGGKNSKDKNNNNSGKSDNSRSEKPTGKGGAGSDSGRNPGDKAKSGKGDGERSRQAGDGADRTGSSAGDTKEDNATDTSGNGPDRHRGKNKGQGSQVGQGSKGKDGSDGNNGILRPQQLGSNSSGAKSGANGGYGKDGKNDESSTPSGSMNATKLDRKRNKLGGDNPDLSGSDGKLNGIDGKNGKRGKNGEDGEALNKKSVTDEPLIEDGTTKRTIDKSKNKQAVGNSSGSVTDYPDVVTTDGFTDNANAGGTTISVRTSGNAEGLDNAKSGGPNTNKSAGNKASTSPSKSGASVGDGSKQSSGKPTADIQSIRPTNGDALKVISRDDANGGADATTRGATTVRAVVGGPRTNNTGSSMPVLAAVGSNPLVRSGGPSGNGASRAGGVGTQGAGGAGDIMSDPQDLEDAMGRMKRMHCFPADALVTTVTGPKRMDQLAVGDFVDKFYDVEYFYVLIPSASDVLKYERVEMFYHREPETRAKFVVLMTESKKRIALTAFHLLPFGECESMRRSLRNDNGIEEWLRSSRFADKAEVGDCLMTIDDNGRMTIERIVKIGRQISEGIYSPMTVTGSLLVDGVLSSCFSQVESHTVQKVKCILSTEFQIVFDFFVYVRQFLGLHPGRHVEREGIPSFISYIYDLSHMFLPFSNF
ncbi:hint module, partial [Dictyocaulus viviparus]